MKHQITLMIVFIFTISIFAQSLDEKKKSAEELIKSSIEYIKKNGKEKAFEEFNMKDGKFVNGEFYVFAFDMNGVTLAHGANIKLIGKNQIELADPKGVKFVQEFIKVAKDSGEGWVDYSWIHPVSKKLTAKTTLIKKVDDNSFIGCGFYK